MAQGEKGFPVALILLSSPPFLKDPDHLQDLVGKQRSPGVHTSGGESPAPRLPGPWRYQIASWATKFMRSAASVLIGFCAMGPEVSSPSALHSAALGSASHVARETGC